MCHLITFDYLLGIVEMIKIPGLPGYLVFKILWHLLQIHVVLVLQLDCHLYPCLFHNHRHIITISTTSIYRRTTGGIRCMIACIIFAGVRFVASPPDPPPAAEDQGEV